MITRLLSPGFCLDSQLGEQAYLALHSCLTALETSSLASLDFGSTNSSWTPFAFTLAHTHLPTPWPHVGGPHPHNSQSRSKCLLLSPTSQMGFPLVLRMPGHFPSASPPPTLRLFQFPLWVCCEWGCLGRVPDGTPSLSGKLPSSLYKKHHVWSRGGIFSYHWFPHYGLKIRRAMGLPSVHLSDIGWSNGIFASKQDQQWL